MACSCKGKKNVGVTKTPVRQSNVSSNGKSVTTKNASKRIIRREIK